MKKKTTKKSTKKSTKNSKFDTKQLIKKIDKIKIPLAIGVVVLFAALYFFKGQFIAATVDGMPVWRYTLISELEKKAGKDALEAIITQRLILDRAKKDNVTVTDEEITSEVTNIENQFTAQGQDFEQLLELQGTTREELGEQIKIQLLLEKLVDSTASVSAEEVANYYKTNEQLFGGAALETVENDIKMQLEQQKKGTAINAFLEDLKANATINYYLNL
ncbi:SurA N-terminal domain-containing protein [Patescibacteria group bacterium]